MKALDLSLVTPITDNWLAPQINKDEDNDDVGV